MVYINNYVLLEKQLNYVLNKLINSRYFKFNNKYVKTISKFNVEFIKENNTIKCNFYEKINKKYIFSKIIKGKLQ